jgi:hypothetical protein
MTIHYKRPLPGQTLAQLRILFSNAERDGMEDAADYLREVIERATEPITVEEVEDILDQAPRLIKASRLGHHLTWGYEVQQPCRAWIRIIVHDNEIRPYGASVEGELNSIDMALYEAGINAEVRDGAVWVAVDQGQQETQR